MSIYFLDQPEETKMVEEIFFFPVSLSLKVIQTTLYIAGMINMTLNYHLRSVLAKNMNCESKQASKVSLPF